MADRKKPVRALSTDELLTQLKNTFEAIKAMKRGNRPALASLRRHWRVLREELDRRAAEAGPKGGRPKGSTKNNTSEGEEG
jgi:hypothetical protein